MTRLFYVNFTFLSRWINDLRSLSNEESIAWQSSVLSYIEGSHEILNDFLFYNCYTKTVSVFKRGRYVYIFIELMNYKWDDIMSREK